MLSNETALIITKTLYDSADALADKNNAENPKIFAGILIDEYFNLAKLLLHVLEKEGPNKLTREMAAVTQMNVDLIRFELYNTFGIYIDEEGHLHESD